MKVLEAQAIVSGTEAAGEGTVQIITHSRANRWVAKDLLANKYLIVTFGTDAAGNTVVTSVEDRVSKTSVKVMSDGPSKKASAETFQGGVLKLGRNTLNARKSNRDGRVERMTRDGEWLPFTGTAKFQAR